MTKRRLTNESASSLGKWKVGSYSDNMTCGQYYSNPTVYYPEGKCSKSAGIIATPGFLGNQSNFIQWANFLASHGFIVMLFDTAIPPISPPPQGACGTSDDGVTPPTRSQSIIEITPTFISENSRRGSPIKCRLNIKRIGLLGHSMGGSASFLTANKLIMYKAIVGLDPFNFPSGSPPPILEFGDYTNVKRPSLIIQGSDDIIELPEWSLIQYATIPNSTIKSYAEYIGGDHTFALYPLGKPPNPQTPTEASFARLVLSWYQVYLLGNRKYKKFIHSDPTMSQFLFNKGTC